MNVQVSFSRIAPTPPYQWFLVLAFLVSAVGLAGCQEATVLQPGAATQVGGSEDEPLPETTLALRVLEATEQAVTVELVYHRQADQPGARMMELHLSHSANLAWRSVQEGEAAERADRDVVVQAKDAATLRVVIYGTTSLERMDSGTLARLTFARIAPGTARLELLPQMPLFAPAEANDSLLLPEPLTVGD